MKRAIISGATGLVGAAVADHLTDKGIDVLCLGREIPSPRANDSPRRSYLAMDMADIGTLPEQMELMEWDPGDSCVFFNFAWAGREKLTDGELSDQLENAVYSAHAVAAARKAGCLKFVNCGTMEETFAEPYLRGDSHGAYPSAQLNYTIAKLAARDMCLMVAYLEKIDYVHTRLSIPLDDNLRRGGYARTVISKILNREPYELPKSDQLFDITLMPDIAEAYYLIGQSGKNKADYYIGTGKPRSLRHYFGICERQVDPSVALTADVDHDNYREDETFNTQMLTDDTGFVSTIAFESFIQSWAAR